MKVPPQRVTKVSFRESLSQWLDKSGLPWIFGFIGFTVLETILTIFNKFSGLYSKPEEYLNSLVEFSKSINENQKVAIVTGANSGIGYVTVKYLYKAGYYVILACRSQEKAQEAIDEIRVNGSDGQLKFIKLDCNSLTSVQEFVKEFEKLNLKLDLLVNNAGIMMTPYGQTVDHIESQIGVNFVSHYLLTDLLIPHLNTKAKIINLSSLASFYVRDIDLNQITNPQIYHPVKNYAQSKLAMIVFTYYLHQKLRTQDFTVYSVHPGMVITNLVKDDLVARIMNSIGPFLIKDAEAGTFTTLRCALLPPAEDHDESSLYFCEENSFASHIAAYNQKSIDELMNWTKETIQSKGIQITSF